MDGENLSQDLALQIVNSMNVISDFAVQFNEEFDDELIHALAEKIHYSNELRKLSLKKGIKYTSPAFT